MGESHKFQHYVPQFYLKNFSSNNKSVGIYNFNVNKYISNASIKDNFGKNYFYGDDKRIEMALSKLESTWAIIINNIIKSQEISISEEELSNIILLFFISDIRTISSSNNMKILFSKMKEDIKDKGASVPREISEILNSSDINRFMIEQSIASLLLCDLKLILIKNKTKTKFITSDSVVAKYNQLAIQSKNTNLYGYSSVGLQMFMPISSHLCLCLYDDNAYNIPKLDNNVVELRGNDDIIKLNRLFIYNSHDFLIFEDPYDIDSINKQIKKTGKRYSYVPEVFESITSKDSMYRIEAKCIRKEINLKFFKINNIQITNPYNNKILDREQSLYFKNLLDRNDHKLPINIINKLNNEIFVKRIKNKK